MTTQTDRFATPIVPTDALPSSPSATAYLLDGTPVDFDSFCALATSLESELTALEARFQDYVTAHSRKRNQQRGR